VVAVGAALPKRHPASARAKTKVNISFRLNIRIMVAEKREKSKAR